MQTKMQRVMEATNQQQMPTRSLQQIQEKMTQQSSIPEQDTAGSTITYTE
uniref:Uncharacterized protein n=1 Tax=Arion vulgaris TaxID=1028688 RepID=A0A0B7AU25_9EUPU